MELKIAMQPTVFELQVIDLGLELVVQHIEDGESISIVDGRDSGHPTFT